MSRRGPKEGYDFGNKAQYRRTVWKQFRNYCMQVYGNVALCHALLMPSNDDAEIQVALANGFREDHLHIVDDEKAYVAVHKRKYPGIHTYGVVASRAIERIAESDMKLTCANFDFCESPLSDSQERELVACFQPSAFTDHNLLAITGLCGRDDVTLFAMYKALLPNSDDARMLALRLMAGYDLGALSAAEMLFTKAEDVHTTYKRIHSATAPYGPGIYKYKSINGQTMAVYFIERLIAELAMKRGAHIAGFAFTSKEYLGRLSAYRTTRGTTPPIATFAKELLTKQMQDPASS